MRNFLICAAAAMLLSACSSVDMVRTSSARYEPTDPASIHVLKMKPDEKYVELGAVTMTGFSASQEAAMHDAIRAKAAALGADAVIITSEGLTSESWGRYHRWATGVAIRYKD